MSLLKTCSYAAICVIIMCYDFDERYVETLQTRYSSYLIDNICT